MIFNLLGAAVLVTFAATAEASIKINNWCGVPVNVVLSHNGGCDYGSSGKCISQGGKPWVINSKAISAFDWIADGKGTSMKLSKPNVKGILQFEYTVADGIYWDLSDLDGGGPGLVGTPFGNDNVKVSPTGNGSGQGTCVKIRCTAGKVCLDSYQHPDDPNTKWCPKNTGDMWIDLCQPKDQFNSKRDLEDLVPVHVARHQGPHARRHAKN